MSKTRHQHRAGGRLKALVMGASAWIAERALGLYLWLYDEKAAAAPNADIHRKIIWELRDAIRRLRA